MSKISPRTEIHALLHEGAKLQIPSRSGVTVPVQNAQATVTDVLRLMVTNAVVNGQEKTHAIKQLAESEKKASEDMRAAARLVLHYRATMVTYHLPHAVVQRYIWRCIPTNGVVNLCQRYVRMVSSRVQESFVLSGPATSPQRLRLSAMPLTPQNPLCHAMVRRRALTESLFFHLVRSVARLPSLA